MNNSKNINIYIFMIISSILLSKIVYADSENILTAADYDELCDIYKTIADKSISLSLKEMRLTENVQNKLPNLFDNLFKHIMWADAKNRYQLIRDYAKQQNNLNWKCEIAFTYYDTEFGVQ